MREIFKKSRKKEKKCLERVNIQKIRNITKKSETLQGKKISQEKGKN